MLVGQFFGQGGEGVDIEALKKEVGVEMKTWEEFLRTECVVVEEKTTASSSG